MTRLSEDCRIGFGEVGIGFGEAGIGFGEVGIGFSEVGIVFSYNSYNYYYYTPTKLVLCVGGDV